MFFGGGGGAGAGAGAGPTVRGTSPSRGGPATVAKRRSVGLVKGDDLLCAMWDKMGPREPAAYFASSHGVTHTFRSDKLISLPVPRDCVYVTNTRIGNSSYGPSFSFCEMWADPTQTDTFNAVGSPNAVKSSAAWAKVLPWLEEPAPGTPPTALQPVVERKLYGEHYSSSMVEPFCSWYGDGRPYCVSSGLKACPGGTAIRPESGPPRLEDASFHKKIFLPMDGSHYTDELIREIFEDSVFPTVDQLLADEPLRRLRTERLYDEPDCGFRRYRNVSEHIHNEYMCSQMMLFQTFPGVHYHLICRLASLDGERARMPPPREMSRKAMEVASAAAAAAGFPQSSPSNAMSQSERRFVESDTLPAVQIASGGLRRRKGAPAAAAAAAAEADARSCCCGPGCRPCSWCPWRPKKNKTERTSRRVRLRGTRRRPPTRK